MKGWKKKGIRIVIGRTEFCVTVSVQICERLEEEGNKDSNRKN